MLTKKLLTDLPPIVDNHLNTLKNKILNGEIVYKGRNARDEFIDKAHTFFTSSNLYHLHNIESFPHIDIIMGCQHFIDGILVKHGINGVQILENDYGYYKRLNPSIIFAKEGQLENKKPLLMSAPTPGYLDLRPNFDKILTECQEKEIPVHLDACWLGASKDIEIDLSHPAIYSIGMSFSKGQGFDWNRIGLRWSRMHDDHDNICLMNDNSMIPEQLIANGILAIDNIPIDYLWNTYGDRHQKVCQELKLRPTKMIHVAQSLDRSKLFGLKDILTQE